MTSRRDGPKGVGEGEGHSRTEMPPDPLETVSMKHTPKPLFQS